ncbi:hypothetical protein, partial [Amycolatopsis bartoniae]
MPVHGLVLPLSAATALAEEAEVAQLHDMSAAEAVEAGFVQLGADGAVVRSAAGGDGFGHRGSFRGGWFEHAGDGGG